MSIKNTLTQLSPSGVCLVTSGDAPLRMLQTPLDLCRQLVYVCCMPRIGRIHQLKLGQIVGIIEVFDPSQMLPHMSKCLVSKLRHKLRNCPSWRRSL